MTKSSRPRAGHSEPHVVEIDAIDVAEWERDQHTPQAPPAGLAALVRQTAAQPNAEPRQRPPTEIRGSRRGSPNPPPGPARDAPAPSPAPARDAGPAPSPAPAARDASPSRGPTRTGRPAPSPAPPQRAAGPARSPAPARSADPAPSALPARPAGRAPSPAPARIAGSPPSLAGQSVPVPVDDPGALAPGVAPLPLGPSRTERISAPPRAPFPVADRVPPARLDPISLPDASPLPRRLHQDPPPEDPVVARGEGVPLPLIAPPSAPIASASDAIPPAHIDPRIDPRTVPSTDHPADSLRAIPDHTPAPSASDAPAPGALHQSRLTSFTSSLGSLRTLVIVGAAITTALTVAAVLVFSGSEPGATATTTTTTAISLPPASAALPPASAAPPPAPAAPRLAKAPDATATAAGDVEPARASRTEPARTPRTEPATPSRTAPARVAITSRPSRTERAAAPQPEPRAASSPRTTTKRAVRRPAARRVDPEVAAALTDDDEPAVAQARAAYAAGNEALFAGDFETAIEAYRRAVAHAPSYAAGYRGLGLAYAVKGDSPLALKALRTYLNLAPGARDVALIKRRIAGLQARQ